jgi:hypothetical protein
MATIGTSTASAIRPDREFLVGNIRFRVGRVDGPDAEVVRARVDGREGVLGNRNRASENRVVAEHVPCGGHREVVVAEMDAVGVERLGECDAVVHDEGDVGLASAFAQSLAEFVAFADGTALFTELDDVDSVSNGRRNDLLGRTPRGATGLCHQIGVPRFHTGTSPSERPWVL